MYCRSIYLLCFTVFFKKISRERVRTHLWRLRGYVICYLITDVSQRQMLLVNGEMLIDSSVPRGQSAFHVVHVVDAVIGQ